MKVILDTNLEELEKSLEQNETRDLMKYFNNSVNKNAILNLGKIRIEHKNNVPSSVKGLIDKQGLISPLRFEPLQYGIDFFVDKYIDEHVQDIVDIESWEYVKYVAPADSLETMLEAKLRGIEIDNIILPYGWRNSEFPVVSVHRVKQVSERLGEEYPYKVKTEEKLFYLEGGFISRMEFEWSFRLPKLLL